MTARRRGGSTLQAANAKRLTRGLLSIGLAGGLLFGANALFGLSLQSDNRTDIVTAL
jgi:hypothetical protein